MSNPSIHTCPDCGWVWAHGAHGGHSCVSQLLGQLSVLREQLDSARNAYEMVRKDCFNLTEKVIPNMRSDIEALRMAEAALQAQDESAEDLRKAYELLFSENARLRIASELQPKAAWIAVEDGLPEEQKLVTVYVDRYGYYPNYLSQSSRQNGAWRSEEGTWQRISHWMPLPAAPSPKAAISLCSDERPCIPCYTDSGSCLGPAPHPQGEEHGG